jgi:ketosteroid isomerase-like protein
MMTADGARVWLPLVIALDFLFVLASNGCQPTLDEEAQALLATDVHFAATSVEDGMSEAFFRFMAPDGMQLRPGEEPVTGPQAIKDRMSKRKDIVLSWTPRAAEVSASRDMGYTWGVYALDQVTPEGNVRLGSGKYLNIWKKQSDGSWKVLVDIGNEDPPPTPSGQ